MDSLCSVADNLMVNFFLPRSNGAQTYHCPILFVGHGLVCFAIKNLMFKVKGMKGMRRTKRKEEAKFDKFVDGSAYQRVTSNSIKKGSVLFPFYTYKAFMEATMKFLPNGSGVDESADDQRKEIAALLAHIDHGTSGKSDHGRSALQANRLEHKRDQKCSARSWRIIRLAWLVVGLTTHDPAEGQERSKVAAFTERGYLEQRDKFEKIVFQSPSYTIRHATETSAKGDESLNTDASNEAQVPVPTVRDPTEEEGSDVRATETASSSDNRLNDALFVLYEPPDGLPYDTEIIFVHDLYTEGSEDAWKTTWTNDDGTCWPRDNLAKRFPRARILSVSYDACVTTDSTHGRMDSLTLIAEYVMVNIFDSGCNVGQTYNCPILFVGHGLGCFVLKNLMIQACEWYKGNKEKRKILLRNVGGFVFYSPFNSGVKWDPFEYESGESNPLTDCMRPYHPELSRLNDGFSKLRRFMQELRESQDLWKVLTICESDQTPGPLQRTKTFVVEATARPDSDLFFSGKGDHFHVCKHQSTEDTGYQCFEKWLDDILKRDNKSCPNSIPEFNPIADENIWKARLPRKVFIDLFPSRIRFYTYEAFTEAAMAFIPKGFLVDGSVEDQTREIAALLAHFDHGTSGLLYKEQSDPPDTYCLPSKDFPCYPGKSYHGRGPLQLCWNYNYKMCGEGIGDDSLLSRPEKLSQDPVIAFKSALWFWCTRQWNKPSCHSVMTGNWTPLSSDIEANRLPGFGLTINIINGIECNIESAEANSRVEKYRKFCELLAVNPGENIDCRYQKPFG
ncbi:hypothetical protein AXG93_1406s1050 [Marchantia polymorpha subsp. ruderalis]|uniref:Glycoside hydrolase family 19 catalytic domain-containing protein n=3 Tax=Marchantia polymorpha TaxID=3197 RepID=A0A176W1M8_MARPO|nr:hypothetical protein AXG93_1406s1050 [Marchantia polymorpha subsp. ruderalis]